MVFSDSSMEIWVDLGSIPSQGEQKLWNHTTVFYHELDGIRDSLTILYHFHHLTIQIMLGVLLFYLMGT